MPHLLPGQGSSLGAIVAKEVEVRAFGPQPLPLSDDSRRFGVRGAPLEGWTSCIGLPEVWMEAKTHSADDEWKLDVRFVGLKPETPLAFVFYIKAASCTISSETIRPNSLRQFQGEANFLLFPNYLTISTPHPHKVQVIPLAGDAAFWGAQFLASFEINSFDPRASFVIK